MFPLAFVAGWLQGHWWGFISRNYVVWPTFLLMNVFIALKGSHFWFLFLFYLFGPRFDLYQSLGRLPIWNSQNCSMFPLAFVAGWLQGHWWGFISRNYVVWPTFLLMNVFTARKGSHFRFLLKSETYRRPVIKADNRDLVSHDAYNMSHKTISCPVITKGYLPEPIWETTSINFQNSVH